MSLTLPIPELLPFGLAFVRIAGLLIAAPIFGHRMVPARVRAVLALFLALVIAPVVEVESVMIGSLGWVVLVELLVGLGIGFAGSLIFAAVAFMAEIVSVQGGLGAASVLDPTSESSSVIVAALMRSFAILVFLAIDGHHEIIRALAESYVRIPIGSEVPLASLAAVASIGGIVFEAGLQLAAPLTVILFVSNIVVGILGRTIPQLNLITLQLPAQVGLTLLVIGLGAGVFIDSLAEVVSSGFHRSISAMLGVG